MTTCMLGRVRKGLTRAQTANMAELTFNHSPFSSCVPSNLAFEEARLESTETSRLELHSGFVQQSFVTRRPCLVSEE